MQELHHLPAPGEFYRHEKGNLYQVLAIAIHTETKEPLVVYQALYGEFKIFACPLPLFLGKTEEGKGRFVKTETRNTVPVPGTTDDSIASREANKVSSCLLRSPDRSSQPIYIRTSGERLLHEEASAALLQEEPEELIEETGTEKQDFYERMEQFYDAGSYEKKLDYLFALRDDLNDAALTNIALSLDIAVPEGSFEERFQSIVSCLKTMKKYQSSRLR